jgi:uncharacterized protein
VKIIALVWIAILAAAGAVSVGAKETIDEALARVKAGQCPANLATAELFDGNAICNPNSSKTKACDANYPAASKSWVACYDDVSACRKRVDSENNKVYEYNHYVYVCRANKQKLGSANQPLKSLPRKQSGQTSGSDQLDFAPGFDCSKASNNVEATICSNERLARADNNLNKAYRQLLERLSSPEEIARIRAAQKAFLNKRNRCTTPTCIDDAYTQRTEEIYDETSAANDILTSQPSYDPLDQKTSSQDNDNALEQSSGPWYAQEYCDQAVATIEGGIFGGKGCGYCVGGGYVGAASGECTSEAGQRAAVAACSAVFDLQNLKRAPGGSCVGQ